MFSPEQVEDSANVIVIGRTLRENLFGLEDPLGKIVRINNQLFEVVGLLAPKGQSGTGQDQDDTFFLPSGETAGYGIETRHLRVEPRQVRDTRVVAPLHHREHRRFRGEKRLGLGGEGGAVRWPRRARRGGPPGMPP